MRSPTFNPVHIWAEYDFPIAMRGAWVMYLKLRENNYGKEESFFWSTTLNHSN